MIGSFRNPETEVIWQGQVSRKLDAANTMDDLRMPPSNHLEALQGNRKGQLSIRINDQWRICFRWRHNEAHEVEIVDYHKG